MGKGSIQSILFGKCDAENTFRYNRTLARYQRVMNIDLESHMTPPQSLYVEVGSNIYYQYNDSL